MIIEVKVFPSSGRQEIIKNFEDKSFKVYLKSGAENNKANIELIKFLSKHFNVGAEDIKIKRGKTLRNKVVEVLN